MALPGGIQHTSFVGTAPFTADDVRSATSVVEGEAMCDAQERHGGFTTRAHDHFIRMVTETRGTVQWQGSIRAEGIHPEPPRARGVAWVFAPGA